MKSLATLRTALWKTKWLLIRQKPKNWYFIGLTLLNLICLIHLMALLRSVLLSLSVQFLLVNWSCWFCVDCLLSACLSSKMQYMSDVNVKFWQSSSAILRLHFRSGLYSVSQDQSATSPTLKPLGTRDYKFGDGTGPTHNIIQHYMFAYRVPHRFIINSMLHAIRTENWAFFEFETSLSTATNKPRIYSLYVPHTTSPHRWPLLCVPFTTGRETCVVDRTWYQSINQNLFFKQ